MNELQETQISVVVQSILPLTEITSQSGRNDFYIYVWLDPRKPGVFAYKRYKFDHEPIYIGKGCNGRDCDFKRDYNGILNRKMQKFQCPIIKRVKENLTEKEAFKEEKKMIATIGRLNFKKGPLCNLTDGGEGMSGVIWSEEAKNKVSIYWKGKRQGENNAFYGRTHSEETKALISKNISALQLGTKHSPEWCANIAKSLKGRHLSKSQKEYLSLINKGKKLSKETRNKISEAGKGRVVSDETKAKISKGNKGKKKPPFTEEHKKKLSMSKKGKVRNEEAKQHYRDASFRRWATKTKEERSAIAKKGLETKQKKKGSKSTNGFRLLSGTT